MLLTNDEKLKIHFLHAKVNLKNYLRLSREIKGSTGKKSQVEMEKLQSQNSAYKTYQSSLSEYSRLLNEVKNER